MLDTTKLDYVKSKHKSLNDESKAINKLGQAIMADCESGVILSSTAADLLTVLRDRGLVINEELKELYEIAESAKKLGEGITGKSLD